ncbi:DUF1772 domain-containing protein [bacterium]|nr:DUF1772 domain-containing protein [bacterium]
MTGNLALTFAALFAGAAFYINFAEQPARLKLEAGQLLRQWAPSYKRGFAMQATLAVLSGLFALYTYYSTNNFYWLIGAVFILANWPFTLLVIMPTNHKILAVKESAANAATVKMIEDWGKLHAVRTALGTIATVLFLTALS